MIEIRKAKDRGIGEHGWLHSRHTFSFANYYDPRFSGFRSLRVINDDRVEGGGGFGRHGHRDMEILSYVLEGKLDHTDSMGTRRTLRPGMVQYMSAGSGVEHSEFNGSDSDPAHFLQIWILPSEQGATPRYEDRDFRKALDAGGWVTLASPDGCDKSFRIRRDAVVLAARMKAATDLKHSTSTNRGVWIQIARGMVEVNGVTLQEGDGAAISEEDTITVTAREDAEVLLFDLA